MKAVFAVDFCAMHINEVTDFVQKVLKNEMGSVYFIQNICHMKF